jgi:mRNA interferase MazF
MKGGIVYNQKDIVLIPFPYSDLTGSKKRPALIISNLKLNKTEDRICCLVTSNTHKGDVEIKASDFQDGKLPFKSSVRAHRVFTIDKRIVIKKLCTVNKEFHDKVVKEVGKYIEIDG